MHKRRRRVRNAFPYLLALAASMGVGSCCILCIPVHPGEQAPDGNGATLGASLVTLPR